jgi:hypothetical protein
MCLLHLEEGRQERFDVLVSAEQVFYAVNTFVGELVGSFSFVPNALNQVVAFKAIQGRVDDTGAEEDLVFVVDEAYDVVIVAAAVSELSL